MKSRKSYIQPQTEVAAFIQTALLLVDSIGQHEEIGADEQYSKGQYGAAWDKSNSGVWE